MPDRPTEPPSGPSPVGAELPEHLVATPVARGLARLGVGTVPFNIVAIIALVGMSALVVASPTKLPGLSAPRELASRDVTPVQKPHSVRTADAVDGPPGSTTTTTARAATTTTTDRTTTTTRRPSSKSTTTTAAPRSGAGQLLSAPVSTRPVRCEDFTLQPDAQESFDADPVARAALDGDGDGIACEQLPGRDIPLPLLAVRRIPTTDQVVRPSARLFGVHTPQAPFGNAEMDSFTAAAGKTPNTVLFFQNFSQEFPATAVTKAWSRGMLPMITFEPIIQDSTSGQPGLVDITNGDWDEYFTRWATAAKADGRPIALRFAQEMNGNWYSWSDARFGNPAGEFVRAWRHVHQILDDVGADNVIWVWSVNRIDNLPDKTLARVYPGDDWVDWVGVSGYLRDVPDGVTPSFDFTFAQTLTALHSVAPSKLVMLTEVGAGTTEANRVTWLASFFQGMLDHPEIIGFNWFNAFKDGGDWRIQYSAATSAAFAAGVADSRYGEIAPVIP